MVEAANISSDEDPEADYLTPRIRLSQDSGKGEREQLILSEVVYHRDFERWRNTMVLDPTPGNIFFCRAFLNERESIHAADGLSWSSSGRTCPSQVKNAKTFYYVANPRLEAMTELQREKFCIANKSTMSKKLKVNPKYISYRKVLTYYINDNFFMIEYYGDVKALPWKKRRRVTNTKKGGVKIHPKKRPPAQSQSLPDEIVESSHQPEDAKRTNGSQSSAKFDRAIVFDNNCARTKYTDLRTIDKLLKKECERAIEKINDALTTRIMNPRAGEIYLMDLSNLSSWVGTRHCDIYCWRNKCFQHWKDYGFITQNYIYAKNSKPYPNFKKTLHYSPGEKMALIHYYGIDDGIPKTGPFQDRRKVNSI